MLFNACIWQIAKNFRYSGVQIFLFKEKIYILHFLKNRNRTATADRGRPRRKS